MLSKKMAFSLMSLITFLALAFAVTPVMAVGEFSVTITGPTSVTYTDGSTDDVTFNLRVETGQPVGDLDFDETTAADNELVLTLFDKNGNVVEAETDTDVEDLPIDGLTDPADAYAMRTAKMRKLRVTIDDGQFPVLAKAILQIKALESTDPSIVLTPKATHEHANMSLAAFHLITISGMGLAPVNTSRPQVVSIQRLRPGSQTVVAAFQEAEVTGAFDVRIVITELPHDFKIDHIEVTNGTASELSSKVHVSYEGLVG